MNAPQLAAAHKSLSARGLVQNAHLNPDGEQVYTRIVEARGDGLAELLDGWEPEQHDELMHLIERLAHELVAEIPESVAQPR
jgi:hypothetical protein